MRNLLIALTVGEVVLLVVVLAAYLIALAATLKELSKTVESIGDGVRAIDRQSEQVGPTLRTVNEALEGAVNAIGAKGGRRSPASSTRALPPHE